MLREEANLNKPQYACLPCVAPQVFMGRTYAGAREDMSDVVGTSSSFSAEGGAVYEGDGYHLRTGGDGGPGESAAF